MGLSSFIDKFSENNVQFSKQCSSGSLLRVLGASKACKWFGKCPPYIALSRSTIKGWHVSPHKKLQNAGNGKAKGTHTPNRLRRLEPMERVQLRYIAAAPTRRSTARLFARPTFTPDQTGEAPGTVLVRASGSSRVRRCTPR